MAPTSTGMDRAKRTSVNTGLEHLHRHAGGENTRQDEDASSAMAMAMSVLMVTSIGDRRLARQEDGRWGGFYTRSRAISQDRRRPGRVLSDAQCRRQWVQYQKSLRMGTRCQQQLDQASSVSISLAACPSCLKKIQIV